MQLSYDNDLYAVHSNGDRLYLPLWDAQGNLVPSGLPLVAVTEDQSGRVFPEGATFIRKRNGHLKRGWKLVTDETLHKIPAKPSKMADFRGVGLPDLRS